MIPIKYSLTAINAVRYVLHSLKKSASYFAMQSYKSHPIYLRMNVIDSYFLQFKIKDLLVLGLNLQKYKTYKAKRNISVCNAIEIGFGLICYHAMNLHMYTNQSSETSWITIGMNCCHPRESIGLIQIFLKALFQKFPSFDYPCR